MEVWRFANSNFSGAVITRVRSRLEARVCEGAESARFGASHKFTLLFVCDPALAAINC